MDKIRNEYMRRTAQVEYFEDKVRKAMCREGVVDILDK